MIYASLAETVVPCVEKSVTWAEATMYGVWALPTAVGIWAFCRYVLGSKR